MSRVLPRHADDGADQASRMLALARGEADQLRKHRSDGSGDAPLHEELARANAALAAAHQRIAALQARGKPANESVHLDRSGEGWTDVLLDAKRLAWRSPALNTRGAGCTRRRRRSGWA